MKLYYSPTSPFARKARIVARERGLIDRIEEIVVDPWTDAPALLATNPAVQVPTLIAEDGLPLTDSPLICDYLDRIAEGPRLTPPDGPEWLRVRRFETLGDAAAEQGVKLVVESRRPEGTRSEAWSARCARSLERILDAMETTAPEADTFDMGAIAVGSALAWLEFRRLAPDWRATRPRLAAFESRLSARPSFAATRPPEA